MAGIVVGRVLVGDDLDLREVGLLYQSKGQDISVCEQGCIISIHIQSAQ